VDKEEEELPVFPAEENGNSEDLTKPLSPEKTPEPIAGSRSVQVLHGVLGLFTTPEIGPETEEEVKTRRELNVVVHRMLLLGLLLSTSVLFTGLALSAITRQPVPSRVLNFNELYHGLQKGTPQSVLSLGILLLIATPVLRVLGSFIEFIVKRDWRFTVITAVVLIILGASLFIGRG